MNPRTFRRAPCRARCRASRARERDNIDDVVARSNAAVAKQTPTPRAARTQQTELNTLDQLLDKISAHGIDSLTADERRVLAEESKRRRTE